MIFGSAIMVDDKGGLTSKDSVKEDVSHPEYEYRMAALSMSSIDAIAVTRRDVSHHSYGSQPLSRGDYEHHKRMFEKDISERRYIKANIDMDSVSDKIYCISKNTKGMVATLPSKIKISIREIKSEDAPDIYCGEFYFNDANEEREPPFNKGDNSLSISLNLDSESFSKIFDNLKNGDTITEFNINFPAYACWLDSMAGVWPTTYIVDPSRNDENFIMLSSISSTQGMREDDNEDEEAEVIHSLNDASDKEVELKDINASIAATNELLSIHATNTKKFSTYFMAMAFLLLLLTFKLYF
ncbi:hypothetical protein [Chimaeribacter arupi]|uniref:hypothetical protein n=1 Tax=Chimaeribacter arupi TaxID=2060066 RepID=UPI002946DB9C|nr:hypothetical protein [Chimaeribacter arupi]MDV5140420.1 hypothetical protein [Chimaeribacter arupi]